VNKFDFITHARKCLCIYFRLACFCCFSFLFFNIKKIKIGGKDVEILYFLFIAFQKLHVFLPDTSVHCSLIEYAYI
jgi:hypothetical protein